MSRILLFLLIILAFSACNRMEEAYVPIHAPFLQLETSWADSVLTQMSLEEKIGQLFIWAPERGLGSSSEVLLRRVTDGQLGGLLLQDLPIDSFLQTLDHSQQSASLPLLIGTTETALLNNQFSDAIPFPLPATLSSLAQDSLYQQLEDLYTEQCRALGINFCFAPTLQQNRPTDTSYYFSTLVNDREALLWQSTRQMNKLQRQNILSFAGDFRDLLFLPGDTTAMLDSILHPFFNLSVNGLSGILNHPSIFVEDTTMFKPMDFLKNYSQRNLDFGGLHLAVVDEVADIETQFLAGVDLFLLRDSLEACTRQLVALVENGFLSERMLNGKVHHILRAKYWTQQGKPADYGQRERIVAALKNKNQEFWIKDLYSASLVLVQNPHDLIPIKNIAQKNFKVVQVGQERLPVFLSEFDFYANQGNTLHLPFPNDSLAALNTKPLARRTVVLVLDQMQIRADLHGAFIKSVNRLAAEAELILVNYGNPYNLRYFTATMAMLQVFERRPYTEQLAAQVIFGGRGAQGQLPLHVAAHLPIRKGIQTRPNRLRYAVPEEVGIAAYKLVGIDAIAKSAIDKKATPGCQVMVVKDGKVIYDKSFGHQSVRKRREVEPEHLYDIASITKVAATTLSAMKLYEKGTLKLNDRLDKHLDLSSKSPIKRLTLKQLLTHQSGLRSYMPITPYVMARDSNSRDCSQYFCFEKKEPFTILIAAHFFMNRHYIDTIWQDVYEIKPRRRKRFLYSDLNFTLLQKVIEESSGKSLDTYVYREFYRPLNLRRTTFRPLDKFSQAEINPTAHDEKWRKQVLRGYVHDESAALLNGVAGNAGLFSNTRDMATLFQMLLNKGSYGGRQYFLPETVELFTKTQRNSRRGLGFDKRNKSKTQACSPKASSQTYGHTGFTGTCVWVDPEEDLIFIFLANRINENYKNKRLFRDKVRRRMHTVVYQALDTFDPFEVLEVMEEKEDKTVVKEAKAEL